MTQISFRVIRSFAGTLRCRYLALQIATSHRRSFVRYRNNDTFKQVTFRYTVASAEQAYQELERDIAGLDRALIIDKLRRFNTLLPVACLPPEILAEVFRHWMAHSRAWLPGFYTQIGLSNKWIRIAHVCHHWREVALNAPTLWNEFLCDDPMFTQEMLSRSKATFLRVKSSRLHAPAIYALRHVLQELPRLQSIELLCFHQLEWEWFDLVDPAAPHLRSFKITANENGEILFDKFELPRLTDLSLVHTPILWSNPIFKPTLTHLNFTSNSALHDAEDLGYILRVLAGMPHLQRLTLSRTLPIIQDDPATADTSYILSLPNLRKLRLEATSNTCTHFLKRTHYRPDVSLDIQCTGEEPSHTDVQHLCAAITVKLRGSGEHEPPCVVRTLRCGIRQVQGWTERFTQAELDQHRRHLHFAGKREPVIDVRLWGDSRHDRPYTRIEDNALVAAFCHHLPFDRVQVLSNTSSNPTRGKDWVVMCAGMKDLRELHVCGHGGIKGIIEALILPSDVPLSYGNEDILVECQASSTPKPSSLLFPKLEVIVIAEALLRPAPQTFSSTTLRDMRNALEKRSRLLGYPLEYLVFADCWNMDQTDADFMEGLANEVSWDGREHWRRSYPYDRVQKPSSAGVEEEA